MPESDPLPQQAEAQANATSPQNTSGEVEQEEEEYDAYDDAYEEIESDAERVFRIGTSTTTPSAEVAIAPSPKTVTLLHERFIVKYFWKGRLDAGKHIAALAARNAILELETHDENDTVRCRLITHLLTILKKRFADNYTFEDYARLVCNAARYFDSMSYQDAVRTRQVLDVPFRVMRAEPELPKEVADAVTFFREFFDTYLVDIRPPHA